MTRRKAVCLAVAVVAVDQLTKLLLPTPEWAWHYLDHSWRWSALTALILPAAMMLWRPVLLPAALFAGGIGGNLLSLVVFGRVANPFVVEHGGTLTAFNVADVSIIAGDVALVLALPWMALSIMGVLRRRFV